ncbi:hypothetical protein K32_27960 [Kaistia sp. 32K]|uniref:hypothetical protein n=1 Tax=Kaistia sp. 32K TaxID=2795690 RepID=UPI001914EC66|nr:hypothetical protein [Kaistia sp. 32K]BCP54179.1 hypothetical protein K32_27960 [Kaistia sp. 32K]
MNASRRLFQLARRSGPAALLGLTLSVATAQAQGGPIPPADIPDGAAPADPLSLAPLLVPEQTDPAALLKTGKSDPAAPRPTEGRPRPGLTLEAKLLDGGPSIPKGVIWRVFAKQPGADGRLPLIQETQGGTVNLPLKNGDYIIHAAYGRAGTLKEVSVGGGEEHDTLVLNAGGLKLDALVGKDQSPLPNLVKFDVFASDSPTTEERAPVVSGLRDDELVRLNAGTYHIVSRYGDANAIARADVRVEAGKLTEMRMFHQAARITLKLVSETGGEALANTSWTVMTPAGETVFDSAGAFPDAVLAIGDYTAIAKHDNQIHERNFKVEPGLNREIEVLTK